VTRPRLGFLGVGWIGRHRLQAALEHGGGEIVAIADPSAERRSSALAIAPAAIACESFEHLLGLQLDAIVIATPSALHAEQAITALRRGLAVFCQKPLARSGSEVRRVVEIARAADRLLGLDLSYRHTEAATRLKRLIGSGELGKLFALDLVFHNAYGPEGAWFYDKAQSGGGCVIDLGVHLVDLAVWLLDFPAVKHVSSQLFASGERLTPGRVEDYAAVQLELAGDIALRLTCSWRLSAGRDAVIELGAYGTAGGAAIKNVKGSFYDFIAERYRGTQTERLVEPPDAWGGRAICSFIESLAQSRRYHPSADRFIEVANVLDAIYEGQR
jgi:predicted dehydrogenase